ncbi:MAG: potassium channel family protein [Candidatus Omnitrophota bacterium]
MGNQPGSLEKEAHALLAQDKICEAYVLFRKAGDLYREKGDHKQAALCLASAASCWALKSGEMAFDNSSKAYEEAAREAVMAGDWEYASLMYRQAAINYERDLEFSGFSECFFLSRECLRKSLARSFIDPKKSKRPLLWLFLLFSSWIWGHGERPGRGFLSALSLIFISALLYSRGELSRGDVIFKPGFLQSLYFSFVTFTTVGYGDITPVGLNQFFAVTEAFLGVFLMSIFIVALSRKYLRT